MFDDLDELAPSVSVVVQDELPLPADLVDDDGGPSVFMPGPGDRVWDEPAPQVPPAGVGFDDLAPSGWLALELDSGTAEPAARAKEDLVAAVVGFDRIASWAQARQARLLAELAERAARPDPQSNPKGIARGFLDGEIAVALKLSMGTAEVRLLEATRLCSVLPATLALWQAGRIDRPKARAILDATAVLAPELAAKVESRVLPTAPQQSVAQLRAALARAVLAVDPDGANERHRHARKGRRVVVDDQQGEGMASLWALLAAHDAHAAYRWLTRLARALGADDPRSMDQRRADLLAQLLSGRLVTTADVAVTDDDPDDDAADEPGDDPAPGVEDAEAAVDGAGEDDAPGGAGQTKQRTDTASTGTASTGTASTGTASTGTASTGTAKADPSTTGTPTTGTAKADPENPDPENPGLGAGAASGGAGRRGASLRPVTPGKPLIEVVMAHSTLTGADDQPAELVGYGPIPACLAREIAADAVWRRLITDPLSGALLDYGRTTYRPPAALADFVRARDRYCRGPLCRQSAANCDLDHLQPWAQGGQTSEDNLNAFCGREHRLKDAPGWKIDVHPDGRLTWITPTGHQLTTERWAYRPDPDPPPPPIAPATALQGSTAPTAHDPDEDLPPF